MDQMINYMQLAWKLEYMLRIYRTCDSMVWFSKYEFNNKLLDGATLLRVTVVTPTVTHIRKRHEETGTTEAVTSALMRCSLSNFFHIKHLLTSLNNKDTPKVLFHDEMMAEQRGDGTSIS